MNSEPKNRYLLALGVAAIGPWIIWPGAELCEWLWGKVPSVIWLVCTLFIVIAGMVATSDRISLHKYWVALLQFVVFWASVFLLKTIVTFFA